MKIIPFGVDKKYGYSSKHCGILMEKYKVKFV